MLSKQASESLSQGVVLLSKYPCRIFPELITFDLHSGFAFWLFFYLICRVRLNGFIKNKQASNNKNGSGQEWAGLFWVLWKKALKAILMVFFAQNGGGLCSWQWFKLRIDDLVAILDTSGFYVLYCLLVSLFNP